MSTRATSNTPSNVGVTQSKGGHVNDEHSKAVAGAPFAVTSVSGNVIEIWSDGAIWDTVANKFLSVDKDLKRN